MTYPYAFHLLSHISNPTAFAKVKSDFSKYFKRGLKRQYKKLKREYEGSNPQEAPDVLLIYSIEFKVTNIDEIEDTAEAYTKEAKASPIQLPFLHLHIWVIADCKKTRPQAFSKQAMEALNGISGLTKARYFKSKDRYVNVFDDETRESTKQRLEPQMYKSLKKEFDDVYDRVKYLAKVEQKDPENIPFRQTFGISRLVKKTTTDKATAT